MLRTIISMFISISLVEIASAATMFKQTGKECGDIFKNKYDIMDPWPTNCKVYHTSNACNKYEMSIDGK